MSVRLSIKDGEGVIETDTPAASSLHEYIRKNHPRIFIGMREYQIDEIEMKYSDVVVSKIKDVIDEEYHKRWGKRTSYFLR